MVTAIFSACDFNLGFTCRIIRYFVPNKTFYNLQRYNESMQIFLHTLLQIKVLKESTSEFQKVISFIWRMGF